MKRNCILLALILLILASVLPKPIFASEFDNDTAIRVTGDSCDEEFIVQNCYTAHIQGPKETFILEALKMIPIYGALGGLITDSAEEKYDDLVMNAITSIPVTKFISKKTTEQYVTLFAEKIKFLKSGNLSKEQINQLIEAERKLAAIEEYAKDLDKVETLFKLYDYSKKTETLLDVSYTHLLKENKMSNEEMILLMLNKAIGDSSIKFDPWAEKNFLNFSKHVDLISVIKNEEGKLVAKHNETNVEFLNEIIKDFNSFLEALKEEEKILTTHRADVYYYLVENNMTIHDFIVHENLKMTINEDVNDIYSILDEIDNEVEDFEEYYTPIIDPFFATDQFLTGIAGEGLTVQVKKESDVIGVGTVQGSGAFSIELPPQKPGDLLRVTVKDHEGNESKERVVLVNTIVSILDPNLETAIRESLQKGLEPITLVDMYRLENLSLSYRSISDLTGLEYAKNLKNLNLSNNLIKDISAIENLSNLESLILSHNPIQSLEPLLELPNLNSLYIEYVPFKLFYPSAQPIIEKLKNKGVQVHHYLIPDVIVGSIVSKQLGLPRGTEMTKEHLKNLTSLEGGIPYSIMEYGDEYTVLYGLENAQNLNSIKLGNSRIKYLDDLASLKSLQLLHLPNNKISDISALRNLENLNHLMLYDNELEDITPLEHLTALEYLNISFNPIEHFEVLLNLPKLKEVKMNGIALDDADAKIVRQLKMAGVKVYNPPTVPIVKPILSNHTTLTGRVELSSRVQVSSGNKTLGNANVEEDGGFVVTIPPQPAGTEIRITAYGDDVYLSSSIIITVTAEAQTDTVPSEKPSVPRLSWGEKMNVDAHHNWTIAFNDELDSASINADNIFVQHNNENVEPIKISLSADKKSIRVEAPTEGYKAGEAYFLFVEKSIKSASGKELKQPIQMKFTIK